MAAGGKWTVQNKKRPGAYINFVAVPKASSNLVDRGTVAICVPMTWGPANEIIELLGSDLLNGQSLLKIGCTAADVEASLPFRLALAGCYKALIFRADDGGTEAMGTVVSQFTATAKYAGTTGNKLSVDVVANEDTTFTVNVKFSGVTKESFTVANVAALELVESDWVEFKAVNAGVLAASAGVTLAGGTNGAVAADFAPFFAALGNKQWDCAAVQSVEKTVSDSVVTNITSLRDVSGRKVQAVVYGAPGAYNYEGIISVDQGFVAGEDTVGNSLFPIYVASITAGAAVNQSNTGLVIPNATKISVNDRDDGEIEAALALGQFLISYRQDGAVVVEQDINSLHNFTVDKNYAFSKNRVIRCLDSIANNTAAIFNNYFKGKVDNTADGRNLYKAELIRMMDNHQAINAIQNFAGAEDVTVLPGEAIDATVVDMAAQPVDSIEKMYMTVNVG